MVNFPVFFTSAVASTEKSSSTFETSGLARPLFVAKASTMAVFVMDGSDLRVFNM